MGKIVVLDDLTINQIAAGEVIERPASAVKELVDNSIDALSSSIVVEIRNGGTSYIRVTDNGKGISNDDIEIAFERHATSKIRQAEDLKEVKTMGFRGEALASIAAISNVELISKTEDEEYGNRIVVEAGQVLEFEETGAMTGTTITIKNLFFNTPVRYKFLKKDYTESGYIEDVITRYALANPNIAFKLINEGKMIIQTSGNGNIKDVIYSIYGKEIANSIEEVDYEFDDMHITGVIGKPDIARSNRANELFFINKRYVKDRILYSATESAYKGILQAGKYAFVILNIDMNPSEVDVNVHPAKLEVRFEYENRVFQLVYSAIKNALDKAEITKMNNEDEPMANKEENKFSNLFKKIEMESLVEKGEVSIQNTIQDDIDEKFRKLIESLHSDEKTEDEKNEDAKEEIENNSENENIQVVVEENKEENVEASKEETDELGALIEKLKSYASISENSVQNIETPENEVNENMEKQNEEEISLNNVYEQETKEIKEEQVEQEIKEVKEEQIEQETKEVKEEQIEQEVKEVKEEQVEQEVKEIKEEQEETKKIEILSNISNEQEDNIENIENTAEEKENLFKSMYKKIFGSSVDEEDDEKPEEISKENIISVFDESEEYNISKNYKYIGLAFDNLIIIEMNDEMLLVDIKSAYKRIMYEKIKNNFYAETDKDSQMLLLPDIITLTHKEMEIAKDNFDIFEKSGFTLEGFGENTIKLSGVPSICENLDTKEIFLDILDEINTAPRTEKKEIEEKFIITLADNIAKRVSYELNENTLNALIQNLLELPNPFGLKEIPITVAIKKSDIEKKFARRK